MVKVALEFIKSIVVFVFFAVWVFCLYNREDLGRQFYPFKRSDCRNFKDLATFIAIYLLAFLWIRDVRNRWH